MLRQVNQSTRAPEHQPPVKALCLCVLSAVLLILPFANPNYWVFAWVGFIPLFFILQNKSIGAAFLLSYFTGFIFWLGTIYWLTNVTITGYILLSLYLALYFGLFGFFISFCAIRNARYLILLIPVFWVCLEYLRAYFLTGFPWALLGYSQYKNLPIIQIADIAGAYGVSFLVMMGNVFIYCLVSRFMLHVTRRKQFFLLPILFIIIALIYGFYRICVQRVTCNVQRIKVSLIQPNIPQELKWDPTAKEKISRQFLRLTQDAAKDSPDLIILPETAVQDYLVIEKGRYVNINEIAGFIKEINIPFLIGAVIYQTGNDLGFPYYFNSAVMFSRKGEILQRYDKLHLVPFGEYMPLRNELPFLEAVVPIGDFTPGKEYVVFRAPHSALRTPHGFSVLICFEDVFSGLARNFVKNGADFLVNITNDAWFGDTSEPYQHLAASVFRAVENRRSLVRAANTGISCFISAQGKIIPRVSNAGGKDTFVDGYISGVIETGREDSFYSKFGDVFAWLCFLLVGCGIIIKIRRTSASEHQRTSI